ncbi:hypothetical protein R3P38DRAFT_3003486, partial [Favolaschia claudopus]
REVFETAATKHHSAIPTLLRVCRRVHSWYIRRFNRALSPALFSFDLQGRAAAVSCRVDSILLWIHQFAVLLPTQFPSRIGESKNLKQAVRHLLLRYDSGYNRESQIPISKFLSEMPGLESLALIMVGNGIDSDEIFNVMDGLRILKRLNLCVPSRQPGAWARSILSRSLFLAVTHLELYYEAGVEAPSWVDWAALASLPALTHLCLEYELARHILLPTSDNCKQLTLLVIAFWRENLVVTAQDYAQHLPIQDSRVVVMVILKFQHEWEQGARFGNDFWARADAFVARRRDGDVKRSISYIRSLIPIDTLYLQSFTYLFSFVHYVCLLKCFGTRVGVDFGLERFYDLDDFLPKLIHLATDPLELVRNGAKRVLLVSQFCMEGRSLGDVRCVIVIVLGADAD